MTIFNLFKQLEQGKINQTKFLYEARRDQNLPWITNFTSFEDAVKILKNKGIITESINSNHNQPEYKFYLLSTSQNKIIEGFEYQQDAFDRQQEKGPGFKVYSQNYLISNGLNPNENSSWGTEATLEENDMIEDDPKEKVIEKYKYIKSLGKNSDSVRKALETIASRFQEKYGENIESLDENGDCGCKHGLHENKNSTTKSSNKIKGGKGDKLTADDVNYYEYTKGWKIELEHTDDIEKAQEIALDHLAEDPAYYTNLVAFENSKKPKTRTDLYIELDKKRSNVVDKANGMKEVPKQEKVKSNVKDTLGKKEQGTKTPKGVKFMNMTPQKSKGIKKVMEVPGKEKKIKLKEAIKRLIIEVAEEEIEKKNLTFPDYNPDIHKTFLNVEDWKIDGDTIEYGLNFEEEPELAVSIYFTSEEVFDYLKEKIQSEYSEIRGYEDIESLDELIEFSQNHDIEVDDILNEFVKERIENNE